MYKQTYYEVKDPIAFTGNAYRIASKTKHHLNEVKKWLLDQPAYSLNKPYRKRFPTRKYLTSGINELWQLDLMEMIPYASVNKGYKYILTAIDVFSRFAYALPLKRKSSEDIVKALTALFKMNKPLNIQTDYGKEFYNKKVNVLLKKMGINHYSVNSQFKAAVVERFNRTLRDKLKRYFTYTRKKVWYNVLQDIIGGYNRSKHKGIFNLRPIDVTKENESWLWEKNNENSKNVDRNPYKKFAYVRISRINNSPFIKNFDQNWSEEVFRIIEVDKKSYPTMYVIEDLNRNVIGGKFYKEELQVIPKLPEIFRVEKILRTKGRGVHKQHFVKWVGYPKEYNSWILQSQLVK